MMKPIRTICFIAAASCASGLLASAEIRPDELAERLDAGESIALIDVRSHADFVIVHIPGAMNIPERVVDPRRLPSSRPVVFYDDGLGRADAGAVVERAAEAGRDDVWQLSGGLAAWESAGLPTTAANGFQAESIPGITYRTLTRAQGRGVVLLDVRQARAGGDGEARTASEGSGRELTDLAEVFPEARVIRQGGEGAAGARPMAVSGAAEATPADIKPEEELTVVIDDGDGSGEEVVRKLRAAGNRRVVLLAGGERILRRQGRPGLERQTVGVRSIDAQEIDQDERAER